MRVGVRELRNRTSQVIEAVRSGERVTLTVRGDPVADIVPHGERYRWLAGDRLRTELKRLAADPGLQTDLDEAVAQTLGDL
ncbi:MAG: type II toxin-antitoxin system prevent-host-death family antitoxin [Candidatus Dormibacteraeota bacterium]|nr:type II toxin-antitoxin system prevent-host-death family antitoxin [Candidatus Dormibacteraeota bacterium]